MDLPFGLAIAPRFANRVVHRIDIMTQLRGKLLAWVPQPVMRGEETCPVRALEAWLRRAKIRRATWVRFLAAGAVSSPP